MSGIREILERVISRRISIDEAEKQLKLTAISEIADFAKFDVGRIVRKGVPEIVLAEGKSVEQAVEISLRALHETGRAIISRCDESVLAALRKSVPEGSIISYNEKARMLIIKTKTTEPSASSGRVAVLTAGTSDIAVAEEAKVVAEEMGCKTFSHYDVGVAGLHRLLPALKDIVQQDVDVVVVVAGREGALPTVVAGLLDLPVVAVPTSVGYGYGEKGVSALMAMLQACSLGIAVVNIDAGVAAGTLAGLISKRISRFRGS